MLEVPDRVGSRGSGRRSCCSVAVERLHGHPAVGPIGLHRPAPNGQIESVGGPERGVGDLCRLHSRVLLRRRVGKPVVSARVPAPARTLAAAFPPPT